MITNHVYNQKWLSVQQVASLFGLSTKTIRSFEKEGLKFTRLGRSVRISSEELERFFFGCENDTLN